MTDPDSDDLIEKCGVFGVYGHEDAATLTMLGLHALQHRGQEAAGIISYDADSGEFYARRALGLVDKVFDTQERLDQLKGKLAIGHNRYSTTGELQVRNVQPLFAELAFGGFGIGHNGNLTNAESLRHSLVQNGAIFQSTTDTEAIIQLMAGSARRNVRGKLIDALNRVEGAYSLVAAAEDQLIGVRDPHGIRPLVLGRLDGGYVLSSETCGLDIIGAEFERDIKPGEMITISDKGCVSEQIFTQTPQRFCSFEYVYFARPDSQMEEKSVYQVRKAIGAELAKETPCESADLVVPVPDSGTPSAIGYAEAAGISFELGIIRNHYVGRTFIQPTQAVRHLGVKLKHNANKAFIEGKNVVLIDDSIVRGTTSAKIVQMIREAGAAEVHMRISSPPTKHCCHYGINTPRSEELLAHNYSVDEIAEKLGVDSLAYVSVAGLYRAIGESTRDSESPQYCDACFTGDYPVPLIDEQQRKSA